MRLLQTLLITVIALHMASARGRRPRPNPVMGALQSMLSPQNAERTMQMVKMATQPTFGNSIMPYNQPMPVQYSPPIVHPEPPCNQARISQNPPVKPAILNPPMPVPAQACQTPNQIPVQMPLMPPPVPILQAPIQLPVQVANPTPVPIPQAPIQLPVQMANPTPVPIPNVQVSTGPLVPVASRLPEIVLPEKPCQRELVFPDPVPNCYCNPPITPPLPEISAPIALTATQDIYGFPLPTPAALFNPFLPAASPISTWTSENIPTACSGAKNQYLRKIPIPPPTL